MPKISKILAAAMFLLAVWSVLGPAGSVTAQAYPPNPCDWVDGFDGW